MCYSIVKMSSELVLKESIKILLGYSDLFGRACSTEELIRMIGRYPIEQWLNFLSRIQNTIEGERFAEIDAQRTVVNGFFSARVCDALTQWCDKNPTVSRSAFVVSERQVAVLQELVILHAPEVLAGRVFERDEDFAVLTDALLIVTDILHNSSPVDPNDMLAITAYTQVNLNVTPSWRSFPRAIRFYEIGKVPRLPEVLRYEGLFADATNRSISDYVLGGICCAIQDEVRSDGEINSGWSTIRGPSQCKNMKEAEVVEAFLSLRSGTISEIRSEIERQEEGLSPRDFNLIALSRYPIVKLNNGRFFILNHSALARSLFDGPRHAVMTAAIGRGAGARREVGGAYGQVFQCYVIGLLKELFGDRVVIVPEERYPGHADCILLFKSIIVVVEIKSEHFNARNHHRLMPKVERIEEIKKTGLHKSVNQIVSSIAVLREGGFGRELQIPNRDWTITPIVPLIVTDEQFPIFALLWEGLYSEIELPLLKLSGGAGIVSRMRLLNIDELDLFRDVGADRDFGTLLYQWATDPKCYDFSPKNFLLAHEYKIGRVARVEDLEHSYRTLATRLGLDPNEIKSSKLS